MISVLPRGISVPGDATISPPQAFVNGMVQWNRNLLGVFDFSGIQATSFTADAGGGGLANLVAVFCESQYAGHTYDFSNNHVSDPALIDALLGVLAEVLTEANIGYATIDISGGTNAAPPLSVPHIDEIYKLDFNATVPQGFGGQFTIGTTGYIYSINWDGSFDGASVSGSGILIGVASAPMDPLDVAAGVVSVFPYLGFSGFTVVNNGDGTVTVTDSNDVDYPISASETGEVPTSINFIGIQSGQAAVQDANLITLQNAGYSVTTN